MRLYVVFILLALCSCSETSTPQVNINKESSKNTENCERLIDLIRKKWDYKGAIELIKTDEVDINCTGPLGDTPITSVNHTIHRKDSKDLFQAIVNHPNFDAQAKNSSGENGLFNSTLSLNEIKTLVEKGADINTINAFGETPLNSLGHYHKDLLDRVQFFIEHKNYKKHQKSLNRMLYFVGDRGALIYLLAKGAQISFDQDNRSPLHNLIGDSPMLPKAQLILKQAQKEGLDLVAFINHKTKITSGLNPIYDGDTALHTAVRDYNHRDGRELIEHLLAWGADPDLKNNAGESARDIGARTGYVMPAISYRGFPKGPKKAAKPVLWGPVANPSSTKNPLW